MVRHLFDTFQYDHDWVQIEYEDEQNENNQITNTNKQYEGIDENVNNSTASSDSDDDWDLVHYKSIYPRPPVPNYLYETEQQDEQNGTDRLEVEEQWNAVDEMLRELHG